MSNLAATLNSVRTRSPRRHKSQALPLFAYAMQQLSEREPHESHTNRPKSVSTGLIRLDAALHGGFPVGTATLVAGRSHVSTTSLLFEATLAALHGGHRVAFISERMSAENIRGGLAVLEAKVNRYRFRAGLATDEDRQALSDAQERIAWDALSIETGRHLDSETIGEHIFSNQPTLVICDLRPQASGAVEPLRLKAMMQGAEDLSRVARHHKVAVISRVLLPKGEKRPSLTDLPGQGRLSGPFATVLMMHHGKNTARKMRIDIPVAFQVGENRPPVHLQYDERFDSLDD